MSCWPVNDNQGRRAVRCSLHFSEIELGIDHCFHRRDHDRHVVWQTARHDRCNRYFFNGCDTVSRSHSA